MGHVRNIQFCLRAFAPNERKVSNFKGAGPFGVKFYVEGMFPITIVGVRKPHLLACRIMIRVEGSLVLLQNTCMSDRFRQNFHSKIANSRTETPRKAAS